MEVAPDLEGMLADSVSGKVLEEDPGIAEGITVVISGDIAGDITVVTTGDIADDATVVITGDVADDEPGEEIADDIKDEAEGEAEAGTDPGDVDPKPTLGRTVLVADVASVVLGDCFAVLGLSASPL